MTAEAAVIGRCKGAAARGYVAERRASTTQELADYVARPWPFSDLQRRHYAVIEADPPWTYSVFSEKGNRKGAVRHYATMSLPDILALPVADLAAPDAHLFLWTTGPNLQQAFAVMEAWGFRYSSIAFTWVKLNPRDADSLFLTDSSFHVGLGHTTRKNCEFCLLGRRGSPKRLSKSVRELIVSARRQHSRKPDEAYRRIVEYAAGPRLALFAREARPGFDVWGAETTKFDRVAA